MDLRQDDELIPFGGLEEHASEYGYLHGMEELREESKRRTMT
jgi:hypothetical protein